MPTNYVLFLRVVEWVMGWAEQPFLLRIYLKYDWSPVTRNLDELDTSPAPLPPRLPDLDYKLRSTSSSPAHIQRLVKIGKSYMYCICVLVQALELNRVDVSTRIEMIRQLMYL